jgi:hypothetical protein
MWRRRLALRFRRDMDKRAYIHLALMRDIILTVLRVACIFFFYFGSILDRRWWILFFVFIFLRKFWFIIAVLLR